MSDSLNVPEVGDEVPRLGNAFSQWLGKTVLKCLGWRFNGALPKEKKMVIAVAPHTSNWDFVIGLAVVFCLRLKISFFGKHSIFIPPVDRLLRRWGGIPIERSQSHGVVAQISEKMREAEKMILAVAPEGTRSPIKHWKSGFLHIAHNAGVPVLLIGLDYKNKEVCFGPLWQVSSDIDAEMAKVYDFYAKVAAKFPHKVIFPAENKG